MGERNRGFVIAAMLAVASGQNLDEFIDEIITAKCAKCGEIQESALDLIATRDGSMCAPCILGLTVKAGE